MKKILFQGDSITEGGRYSKNDRNHTMGQDYAYLIAAKLLYEFPQTDFIFENRGISSNSCGDLCARWQEDALDLAPDLISILIGANDVLLEAADDRNPAYRGFVPQLRTLLEQTIQSLPGTTIVLMEPFILDSGNLERAVFEKRFHILRGYQRAVKEIAAEYSCAFVPLQQRFDDAQKLQSPTYWVWDSIHPNYAGHELIARAWLQDTKALLGL